MPHLYLENLKRFVRLSSGPLLMVWLGVFCADFLISEALLEAKQALWGPWSALVALGTNELPVARYMAYMSALALTYGLRTALMKPAYTRMRRPSTPQSVWGILGEAAGRLPGVLTVQLALGVIFFATLVVCFLASSPIFFFVEFPLSAALSPVMYLVVARHKSVRAALAQALEMWREHWLLMFTVQAIMLLVSMSVYEATQALAPFAPRAFVLLLGLCYARWVAEMALFFTLDDAHSERA